jgi:hypothetical protein
MRPTLLLALSSLSALTTAASPSRYAPSCQFDNKLQQLSIDGYCVNVGPKCSTHRECFAPPRDESIKRTCAGKGKALRAGNSCLDGVCRHSLFVTEGESCNCFARCGYSEGGYDRELYCIEGVCSRLDAKEKPMRRWGD